MKNTAMELLDYINNSPSTYHSVLTAKKILKEHGFKELDINKKFKLKKGDKYFVIKNSSALIAFTIGENSVKNDGIRMIGAHTDSPCFKIKPYSGIVSENNYIKINTEGYGGMIASTWLDRPLSIAGRVIVRGENILSPIEKFIKVNKPILMIPNLAIHMNREVNEGYKFSKQGDMLPIFSFINSELEKDDYLINLLCSELEIEKEQILDYELYLHEFENGCIMGLNDEFISSSRLDDLWMVFAGLKAITESDTKTTKMLICVDNEEVGSHTSQGADSQFLLSVIERMGAALDLTQEEIYICLENSILISADLAHAAHPNHAEKHDPTNRPALGKGPVIKYSAPQSYATNSISASVFMAMCKENDIPYQVFVNHSDQKGGSTIGSIISSRLLVQTIDLGTAILAMHSIREFGAVCDNEHIIKAFRCFYEMER